MTHDNPNIPAEKTNNQGSSHSGIIFACANSGATNPTTDNTIGKTQQNKCGKIDAIIPIRTAFFDIFNLFVFSWYPQRESNPHQGFRKPLFYPVELWGRLIYILFADFNIASYIRKGYNNRTI